MSDQTTNFASLGDLVTDFRGTLETKKYILLYAYNGTGKTRLSMAFKDAGKNGEDRDTLYFNAFTEDLFTWDNDLKEDSQRLLKLNTESRFFSGLEELEMETRIRAFMHRYADFDFSIDTENWTVSFRRDALVEEKTETIENIKVSRGEENIFVWCFFLAIVQLAIDEQEAYSWVKFIYIDDPISSLDDNNAIAVASHLAQLLKNENNKIKTVISSHHTLFFNVMWNELGKAKRYFLSKDEAAGKYALRDTGDTPTFHHVALLRELYTAAETGNIYTYHFNMLRSILEKTAAFHGFKHFSACIKKEEEDTDGITHSRIVSLLSHGNYSLFEPVEMLDENKKYFQKILKEFMGSYKFNPQIFPEESTETSQP